MFARKIRDHFEQQKPMYETLIKWNADKEVSLLGKPALSGRKNFHCEKWHSRATLADRSGLWTSRSVVRCAVGSKPPVFICSLSIGEVTSCKLDLEFEEKDVLFSLLKDPEDSLDGKEDIAKPSCEGPSNFNSQDRNTTNIDKLEVGVGEYSRTKSVDRMVSDANEEHFNEKTNKSCEEKKLKEVELGDGSSEKAGFDLPDDALESHMKLQNG
ncbi:hypothetical protein LguiB_020490 [Lonicera macranthoides]